MPGRRSQGLAGGVHFSTAGTPFEPVDHLFIGEMEETFPVFLADLAQGKALPKCRANRFPDLALTPMLARELLDHSKYANMLVQVRQLSESLPKRMSMRP
jgi:hypothetical protein